MLSLRQLFSRLRSKLTKADDIIAQIKSLNSVHVELQSQLQQIINDQKEVRAHTKEVRAHTEALNNEIQESISFEHTQRTQQICSIIQGTSELQTAVQRISADIPDHFQHIESLLDRDFARVTRQLMPLAQRNGVTSQQFKIRVHFFFQSAETWTSLESVWSACNNHPLIDAVLVLLPFEHDSLLEKGGTRLFLADKGIPFVDCSIYDLTKENPDLVFLQNPYDSTRPIELSSGTLRRLNIRFAYIPYGLDVGGGEDNLRWQYDLDVQRHAWRVFARSPQHRRMYALHCLSGTRHVVVSGHPKIDHIKSTALSQEEHIRGVGNDRKIILWTPHFTVEKGGWSTFHKISEALLTYFEGKPLGVALLIRPHPLFFGRMRTNGMLTEEKELALRARFNQPPFILFDESSEYLDSFIRSDALMADAGSFLLEYLPTEKPILYLRNDIGPGLNATGCFVSTYYQATDFNEIERFIDMIAAGGDPKRTERLSQISETLHRTDGNVGQFISDYILEHIYD